MEEGNGKFEVVVNSSDSDAETVEICVAVTAPGDKTATVESNVTFNAALLPLELLQLPLQVLKSTLATKVVGCGQQVGTSKGRPTTPKAGYFNKSLIIISVSTNLMRM